MKKIVNGICICLGFLSLALGIVGAVLPVLPTTPFLILSAALFAKSSERFHTWLLSTKLYQRYIGDAVHKKQMTKKAKRNMLVTLGIIFTIGIIFSPVFAKVIILIVAAGHFYYFLCRIKTVEEQENWSLKMSVNKIDVEKKRAEEKKLLSVMIGIYCRGNHGGNDGNKKELCDFCKKLEEYALFRTEKCPFMETKTFCSACKVHCYAKEQREQIRAVMRYAGPRMIFSHPVLALKHIRTTIKEKRKKKNVS